MPIERAPDDKGPDYVLLQVANVKRMDVRMQADELITQLTPYLISRDWAPPGRLEREERRADAAIATLERAGYTYHGAELWKPPLGKAPTFAHEKGWHLGVQNDALYIIEGEPPAASGNDYPNHEADRRAVARVLDEQLAGRIVSDANVGKRYWSQVFKTDGAAAQAAMRQLHERGFRFDMAGGEWKRPGSGVHVGDTRFEGWLSEYEVGDSGVVRYTKQNMRDAYAAGHEEGWGEGRADLSKVKNAIDPRDARCESDARGILADVLNPTRSEPVERYMDGLAMAARAIDAPIEADKLAEIAAQLRAFHTWLVRNGFENDTLEGGAASPPAGDSEGESWAREALAARESEWNAWRFTEQVMAHLRAIGLRRSDDKLFLTIKAPEGHTLHIPIATPPWEPQSFPLTTWMMQKQELLHSIGPRVRHADAPHETGVWYRWDGTVRPDSEGPWCPVTHRTPVTIRFRDGEEKRVENPEQMRWAWSRPYKSCADIVAYRLEDDELPF
jgi:hypothetical protein